MPIPMATRTVMMLVVILMFLASSRAMSNELEDHSTWNYREGVEHVNVANVRSVTRVLDTWGKRIFNEIKTLLHSQPNTLLPDYSRKAEGDTVPLLRETITLMPVSMKGTEKSMTSDLSSLMVREPTAM